MARDYPMIGHDFRYFIPRLLDTLLHVRINGWSIQWYTPTFGAGLPAYPNPQHLQYSIVQLMTLIVDPWIAVLATAFLAERMYGAKITALIIGFAGVLMIVKPGALATPGHLVALAAALLFAGSVTLTKFITRRDSALTVIFMMFAMQTVIGAVPTWLAWVTPPAGALPWIAIVALAGTVSHYCLSKAISLAEATIVMPMDFLRLPLTALVGYLLYSEGIDLWSVLGGLLILAANTLNLLKARPQ